MVIGGSEGIGESARRVLVYFSSTQATNRTLMAFAVDEVSFIDYPPELMMTLKRLVLGTFSNNQFCLVSPSR